MSQSISHSTIFGHKSFWTLKNSVKKSDQGDYLPIEKFEFSRNLKKTWNSSVTRSAYLVSQTGSKSNETFLLELFPFLTKKNQTKKPSVMQQPY